MIKFRIIKDDDRTDSIDISSTDEDHTDEAPTDDIATETIVPTIEPLSVESMETFDDVDEDEAFITELMALHPIDADIVVEDLELPSVEPTVPAIVIEQDVPGGAEAVEDVVRQNM